MRSSSMRAAPSSHPTFVSTFRRFDAQRGGAQRTTIGPRLPQAGALHLLQPIVIRQ